MMFPSTNKQQKHIYIKNNDTYPFFIACYQTCLTDNGSCCNFVTRLTIQSISLEYNGTTVSCIEDLHDEELHWQENATLSKQSCVAVQLYI